MVPAGEICLVIKGTSALGGIKEYRYELIACNGAGLADIIVNDEDVAKSKSCITCEPFDRDSLEVLNGGNQIRFRTSSLHFEIAGTKIVQLDNDRFCAIYGALYDDEDLVRVAGTTYEDTAKSLFSLRGTFSMIYVCFITNQVYVMKDELGMKSLLVTFGEDEITIANCATSLEQRWYELPPFFMTTVGANIATIKRPSLRTLQICHSQRLSYGDVTEQQVEVGIENIRDALSKSVKELCSRRTFKDCVTILFSGGVDSALMASMVAEHVHDVNYIELVNLAFHPKRAPDRVTALCSYEDLLRLYPDMEFKLICVDVDIEEYKNMEPYLYRLIFPNTTHMDMNIAAALHYATRLTGRILNPEILQTEQWERIKHNTSIMKSVNMRVTIEKHSDSVSGVNRDKLDVKVMSEQPAHNNSTITASDEYGDILVSYWDELQSISGKPVFIGEELYKSQSKEVLIGSGADELFGGYGRHAVASKEGASMEEHEINKDLLRLWKRNMGRDDRVVNDKGITALYPFLYEAVLLALIELKINPSVPIDALSCPYWFSSLGVHRTMQYDTLKYSEFLDGTHKKRVSVYINKWILREIALRCGLKHCAHFKKRAIQFGSRSAKTFNMLRGMSNRVASDKGAMVLRKEDVLSISSQGK